MNRVCQSTLVVDSPALYGAQGYARRLIAQHTTPHHGVMRCKSGVLHAGRCGPDYEDGDWAGEGQWYGSETDMLSGRYGWGVRESTIRWTSRRWGEW